MYTLPFLWLLVLAGARINTAYHPSLIFKRYIKLKSQAAARVFISKYDPLRKTAKNAKANQNKLLYLGLIFYCVFAALIIFSAVMLLLPDLPSERFTIDTRYIFITGDTLNAALSAYLALAVSFAEAAFYFINTLKYAVQMARAKRFTKVLYICIIVITVSGAMSMICASAYAVWSFL